MNSGARSILNGYYVQKLFSLNPGTHLVQVQVAGVPSVDDKKRALYASATLDTDAEEVIVKVVNITHSAMTATIHLKGVTQVGPRAKVTLLTSASLSDENSLQAAKKIYPKELSTELTGTQFSYAFEPHSLTVLRIPIQ
jgi:alpha-N-arabinofuranosidase